MIILIVMLMVINGCIFSRKFWVYHPQSLRPERMVPHATTLKIHELKRLVGKICHNLMLIHVFCWPCFWCFCSGPPKFLTEANKNGSGRWFHDKYDELYGMYINHHFQWENPL